MVSRFGPKDFAACGRCGSGQVHPKLLVMGPIAGIDSDSRTFVCRACGHEGLPIFFDTQDARAQFEREKKGLWAPEPSAPKKGVLTIPILPVQTDPLIALRILEHLPVRVATVTGVRWEDGQLNPTAYRASFQEYWDAIGGPRYNAARVFLLDLSGINRANPNFEVTRHLVKRCDVWLDSGGREAEEVMDGYDATSGSIRAAARPRRSWTATCSTWNGSSPGRRRWPPSTRSPGSTPFPQTSSRASTGTAGSCGEEATRATRISVRW